MFSFIQNHVNLYTTLVNPALIDNPPKRKVLVIHCHPSKQSFSTAICDNVVSGLTSAGHEVRLRRLYFHGVKEECYNGKQFEPILSANEWTKSQKKEDIELRIKGIMYDKSIEEAVQDLRWADSAVFVYPTWGGSFPAMLKGYFDRVMLPGVSFTIDKKGFHPQLLNINKIGVVTTFGGSAFVQVLAGDNGRRYFGRSLRSMCAPQCNVVWHGLNDIYSVKKEDKEKFLNDIKDAYSRF